MIRFLTALLSICAAPVFAQQIDVQECSWQSSARNIIEPWEENTRTFANGKTRLAALDTVEPAAGWAYLLVLSPPFGETGDRQCRIVGLDGVGFAGMDFSKLDSGYDPAKGLIFTLPVALYNHDTGGSIPKLMTLTVNQATGDIRGSLE